MTVISWTLNSYSFPLNSAKLKELEKSDLFFSVFCHHSFRGMLLLKRSHHPTKHLRNTYIPRRYHNNSANYCYLLPSSLNQLPFLLLYMLKAQNPLLLIILKAQIMHWLPQKHLLQKRSCCKTITREKCYEWRNISRYDLNKSYTL